MITSLPTILSNNPLNLFPYQIFLLLCTSSCSKNGGTSPIQYCGAHIDEAGVQGISKNSIHV